MFQGFCELDQQGDFVVFHLAQSAARAPVSLDALPTYRVYGPDGFVTGQTGSAGLLDAARPGLYAARLTVSAANGYEAGMTYNVLFEGQVAAAAYAAMESFGVT